MTSDEMIRRLQAEFGDIGDITKFTPTAEQRSNAMMEGMGPSYGSTKGLTLNPEGVRQSGLDGTYSDPTGFRASLTPVSDDPTLGYGHWDAWYDTTGKMTGTPQYIKDERHPGWANKHAEELMAAAFIAATLGAGAFGGAGLTAAEAAAAAAEAASLSGGAAGGGAFGGAGALGGAGGLTAAEAAAAALANAPEFAAAGTLGSSTEAAVAALANAPEFAAAGTYGNPSWYEPFTQGLQSLKDVTDVGKYFDVPKWGQQAITGGARNFLLSGGDPEAALRGAVSGGFNSFVDPFLADVPKELQQVIKTGAQTALQGGSVEGVLKGAVGNALFGPINQAVSAAVGPTAAQAATTAVKQLLTSGSIDPTKLTASMIGDFVGSAVSKETGDATLGRLARSAISGAASGNIEAALKQMAIGALTTPTKKG